MRKNVNNEYQQNGVLIQPAVPQAYEEAKISYDGLLNRSGADQVYAHVGFGQQWDDVQDYRMVRRSSGFETEVAIKHAETLNIAFKDTANNWDNNSGRNYTFEVAQR